MLVGGYLFLIRLFSSWLIIFLTIQQPVYFFIYYSYSCMGMKNPHKLDPIEEGGNNEPWIYGISSIFLRDHDIWYFFNFSVRSQIIVC